MNTLTITHADGTLEVKDLSTTASVGLTLTETHKQVTITQSHGVTESIDLAAVTSVSFAEKAKKLAPVKKAVAKKAPVKKAGIVSRVLKAVKG